MPSHLTTCAASLWNGLTDFVFPPCCLSCGSALPAARSLLCPACSSALREVDDWDDVYRAAVTRLREGGAIREFVAPWYFENEGPLRALVHQLKYRGMAFVGEELGSEVGRRILFAGLGGADVIVPLPLHVSKERERGYNQAEHIARGIAATTKRPVLSGVVKRARFTRSQTALSADERRDNVRGAFHVPRRSRPCLEGRTVLLVDDVVTTGATMVACARALKEAGAEAVTGCALAIAR